MRTYSICLSLTNFTKHNTLKVHPHCHKWQDFLFLWLNNIPLYILYHILFIHLPVDGYTGCFHVLATVNNAAMNMGCRNLLKTVFSFPLDIYPEVELLNHLVVLFLIFWGTSTLFSIVAVPIYILTNRVLGFLFLHILANTLFSKWHGSHLGFHHASISQTCI